jgi:hypothetical protein
VLFAVVVHFGGLRRQLLKGWKVEFSKIAVAVAGSVMAVGVATPAFADSGMTTVPTSINGGVDQVLNEQPLQKVADGAHADSALRTVSTADQLPGRAPADGRFGPTTAAARNTTPSLPGGLPGASLLGGLPLGG